MEIATMVIGVLLVTICATGAVLLGKTITDNKWIRLRQYELGESLSELRKDVKGNGDSLHSQIGKVLTIAQSNEVNIVNMDERIDHIDSRLDALDKKVS